MSESLAPIVLFVFNRPHHTLKTLEALSMNELASASTLYIYADGPKDNASVQTLNAIEETRRILRVKQWCGNVVISESAANLGLANSIIRGVTEVVNRHGKVIVLEDDLITSPGFLKYMNEALSTYQDDERVMHVSGYMYPLGNQVQQGTIFLRILSCWGWATWQRAWRHFSDNTESHLTKLDTDRKIREFNIRGNAPFYQQLVDNRNGVLNTWAVKWYSSWYFAGGFSLFPKTTLVSNIGHDGSGVHCGNDNDYQNTYIANAITVSRIEVVEDLNYLKMIDGFYKTINRKSRISSDNRQPLFASQIKFWKSFIRLSFKKIFK